MSSYENKIEVGLTLGAKVVSDLSGEIKAINIADKIEVGINTKKMESQINSFLKNTTFTTPKIKFKLDKSVIKNDIKAELQGALDELKIGTTGRGGGGGSGDLKATGSQITKLNRELAALEVTYNKIKRSSIVSAEQKSELSSLEKLISKTKAQIDGLINGKSSGNFSAFNEAAANISKISAGMKQIQSSGKVASGGVNAFAESTEKASVASLRLERQVTNLKVKLNNFKTANPRAYNAYQTAIDGMLNSINSNSVKSPIDLERIKTQLAQVTEEAKGQGLMGNTLFDKLKAGYAKFGGWAFITQTMLAAKQAISEMISTVKSLDTSLVDLQIATGMTREETKELMKSYSDLANEIGGTTVEVAKAADGWLNNIGQLKSL